MKSKYRLLLFFLDYTIEENLAVYEYKKITDENPKYVFIIEIYYLKYYFESHLKYKKNAIINKQS